MQGGLKGSGRRVAAASDFEEARQEDATKAPQELCAALAQSVGLRGASVGPGRNSPRLGRRRERRCRGPRAPGAAATGAVGRRRPRPPTPAAAASSAAWRAFNSLLFGLCGWLTGWLRQADWSRSRRYYCTHLMNDWASPLSVGGARSFHSSAPNQWTCAPTHTLHLSARRRPTAPTPGTLPCCSRQRSFWILNSRLRAASTGDFKVICRNWRVFYCWDCYRAFQLTNYPGKIVVLNGKVLNKFRS